MNSTEMRKDRKKLIEDAGKILLKAKEENRSTMTTEEEARFDAMHADADVLLRQIEKIEKQEAAEKALVEKHLAARDAGETTRGISDDPKENDRLERKAFRSFLKYGWAEMPEEDRLISARFRPNAQTMKESAAEIRATGANPQTVTTTAGGHLIPKGFQAELDKATLAYGGVREACRVLTTQSGNLLDWPSSDDTAVKGRLLGINAAVATLGFTVGTVQFTAFKYTSDVILVPSELMQDAAFGEQLDTYIAEMLAQRIGRITNDHFTTGDNSGKPQGIVPGATASGITGFSIAGNVVATSYLWAQQLLALIHSVDPSYRVGASFMLHDTMLLALRKVIDANGQFIFQPGAALGQPDKLYGYPFSINQSMANAGTNLNIPILFGQMKKYVVREVRPMVLLRLNERYADNDQVGFVGFSREDGRILDAGTHPIKSATVIT